MEPSKQKHDDLVFEALSYRRNVGADLDSIRAYVKGREKPGQTGKNDRAALARLVKAGRVIQVGEKWFLTSQGHKLARGHAIRPEWQREDSWILMSLSLCSRKGCGLENIIGAADYIDRSYPSLEQIHGALNRLASGGLLKVRGGRYLLTAKAEELLSKAEACSKIGTRRKLFGLERMLECPCCGIELKKVKWRIVLDEATLKDAISNYIKKF